MSYLSAIESQDTSEYATRNKVKACGVIAVDLSVLQAST